MNGLNAFERQYRTTGALAMIAQSVADVLSHHVKLAVEGSTGCTSTSQAHPRWPAVRSFRTLLQDLATLTRNIVRIGQDTPAAMLASPTPLQQDVFNRLGIPIAP